MQARRDGWRHLGGSCIMSALPMNARTTATLLAALTMVGCGDKSLMRSPDGRFVVAFAQDAGWTEEGGHAAMLEALSRCSRIDVVYAHNDSMAQGAARAMEEQGRALIPIVAVDALPEEGLRLLREGRIHATIENPTCGAVALDLAALAAAGVTLPREIKTGTRVFTANEPQGRPIPSPGDVLLAMLRSQHATVLASGARLRLGMAQCNDREPWRRAMRAEMDTWIRAHPDVVLDYRIADDDASRQSQAVDDFVAQGCQAILVSPVAAGAAVDACRRALAQKIPVIVIDREPGSDDYTCFIGGDNLGIGRAAALEIQNLLPAGGTIVELRGAEDTSPAQLRHRGFAEGLQLLQPK